MEEVSRRLFSSMLLLGNAAVALSGCALTGQTPEQQAVSLQQFKEYSDAAADAAIAAIEAAQADPRYAQVVSVLGPYVQQLQELRQQVDALTVADLTARAVAEHILKALQQVSASPQVIALLGPAGIAFTLALAVISNFVGNLPPPPKAPLHPPAQLRRRAQALRARLHSPAR